MKSTDFLAGLLVGALVGAALGLLFAPQAGEETREQVKAKALKLKDAAAERGREFLERRRTQGESANEGMDQG
jgi:gas vesicle protein